MTEWVKVGNRVMDRAWLRDGDSVHTGEALVLACLLHAKGKTNRGNEEVEFLAKIFNDPNLPRKSGGRGKSKSGKS